MPPPLFEAVHILNSFQRNSMIFFSVYSRTACTGPTGRGRCWLAATSSPASRRGWSSRSPGLRDNVKKNLHPYRCKKSCGRPTKECEWGGGKTSEQLKDDTHKKYFFLWSTLVVHTFSSFLLLMKFFLLNGLEGLTLSPPPPQPLSGSTTKKFSRSPS